MRAPAFWLRHPPGWPARLLGPLGAAYGALTARRMAKAGADAGCPVICVGNFTVGGSGKTPVALHLAEALLARGQRPVFLSRGYGGRLGSGAPVLVDAASHDAAAVGDEPLLLARLAPVIVCADRVAGAASARQAGATVLIMDDGLQNPSLAKTLSLAVIDAASGFGNGLVFPAGPLRASIARQLPFVQAAVLVGPRGGAAGEAPARAAAGLGGLPVISASLAPSPEAAGRLKGQRVLAMAGIGLPEKFLATLRQCGAEIVATRLAGDHAPWSAQELAGIAAEAERLGALVATTEKDAARVGPAMPPALAARLVIVPVSLVIEDGAALLAGLLDKALGG